MLGLEKIQIIIIEMKEYIHKCIKDENVEYKVCIIFEKNKFELILFKLSIAWRAELSREYMSILASPLKMDTEEYFSKMRNYLSDTPGNIEFKVNDMEFIMYCKLENNVKMKMFYCPLERVDYCHSMEKLLDSYYDELSGYKRKFNFASKERDELEESKQKVEQKLEEFIQRKRTDDEVLYSNFVLVLNEKKRQIHHLNQMLQAFKKGRPIQNPAVDMKKEKRCLEKQEMLIAKNEISDSDTEEEPSILNTDDDSNHETDDIRYDETDNLPSTSKQGFDLFIDDDSPPHHVLPKRQKINQETVEYKIQPPVLKVDSHEENQNPANLAKQGSQVDNELNTQDLLDLL